MRILMLKSFSYNVDAAGTFRRTLPEGMTFDEPDEIADAAIAAGCAKPIAAVVISDEYDPYDPPGSEDEDEDEGSGEFEDDPDPPEPSPAEPAAAEPAAPSAKRGKKSEGDDLAPAEAVDPA